MCGCVPHHGNHDVKDVHMQVGFVSLGQNEECEHTHLGR